VSQITSGAIWYVPAKAESSGKFEWPAHKKAGGDAFLKAVKIRYNLRLALLPRGSEVSR